MTQGENQMATIDTENLKQGQSTSAKISGTGAATKTVTQGVEPVEGEGWADLAALEKFMNEELEVFVYEGMEEHDEKIVQLGVNGVNQFVIRGRQQKIKRKFVEALCRAKQVRVTSAGRIGANGDAVNEVRSLVSLQYPFQVMMDPNPKGPAWLRKTLGEG